MVAFRQCRPMAGDAIHLPGGSGLVVAGDSLEVFGAPAVIRAPG